MSRKTQGKGMSRGMSPELLLKQTDGAPIPREEIVEKHHPKLRRVPGLPRPIRRKASTGRAEDE